MRVLILILLVSLAGCGNAGRGILMRGQVYDDPREHNEPPGDLLPAPKLAWTEDVIQAAKDEAKARGGAWIKTHIILCNGPDDLAERTGLPKVVRGGVVVSRANPDNGTIWLSRESRADLAHECGHLFLNLGSTVDDESKCEEFAGCVLARLAAMEQALIGMMNGNDKP